MPMCCIDDFLSKFVRIIQRLGCTHGGIAVDVYDIGILDGFDQWLPAIIILEDSGWDGGIVYYGTCLYL